MIRFLRPLVLYIMFVDSLHITALKTIKLKNMSHFSQLKYYLSLVNINWVGSRMMLHNPFVRRPIQRRRLQPYFCLRTRNLMEEMVIGLNPQELILLKASETICWRTPTNVKEMRKRDGGEGSVVAVTDGAEWIAKMRFHSVEFQPNGEPVVNKEIEIYKRLKGLPYTAELLGSVQRFDKKRRPIVEMFFRPWVDYSLRNLLDGCVPWFDSMEEQKKMAFSMEMLLQCAHALHIFHSQKVPIIHHDIKPDNIMIHSSTKKILYVDFGIARVCPDGTTHYCMRGTKEYMSPEHYTTGTLNRKSDVFSLGCVLSEIFTHSIGAKLSKFRKWRKKDTRFQNGVVQEGRQVRFRDDDLVGGTAAFSRHIESVRDYLNYSTRESTNSDIHAIRKIICQCITKSAKERPSATDLYRELRNLIVKHLREDLRNSYPAPVSQEISSESDDEDVITSAKPNLLELFFLDDTNVV
jgi:serine/threonine protein kinase